VAADFAAMQDGGFVYTIRGRAEGLDVNSILGSSSPYPNELEIAMPGHVPSENIFGARPVGADGKFNGPFIPNPRYTPR
jgi:hypothetical protein